MKEPKQKNIPIEKLTGEPGANDVSLVAMGQAPSDGMESEFEGNEKMFMDKLGFGRGLSREHKQVCMDIEEAYAQLFESLAVIAKRR